MIIYPETPAHNEFLRAWIEARIDNINLEGSACLGVMRDGKLLAVAAFGNLRSTNVEVSFASDNPRWATREAITAMLAYPFYQLRVQRVSALCLKSNAKVRRFVKGIGFLEEGRLRHMGPHKETMFLYGMTFDDYYKRYIDGRQHQTATAATA